MLESPRLNGACRKVIVHTGHWGCGAFGGNRVLMAALQVVSGRLAGLHRLVFHTFDAGGMRALEQAQNLLAKEFPGETETETLIGRIDEMGFMWGVSDGN